MCHSLNLKLFISCVEKSFMCRQHKTISVDHACKQVEGYGKIMTETCFMLKFCLQNTSNGVQFAKGIFLAFCSYKRPRSNLAIGIIFKHRFKTDLNNVILCIFIRARQQLSAVLLLAKSVRKRNEKINAHSANLL